jgi:D-3-phosphoglycerate dehydrogenase
VKRPEYEEGGPLGPVDVPFVSLRGGTIDLHYLDAARARRIAVYSLPGANARGVAELTLLLVLATGRRVPTTHSAVQAGGRWLLPSEGLDAMGELGSRTNGVIGCGAIPRVLIPIPLASAPASSTIRVPCDPMFP